MSSTKLDLRLPSTMPSMARFKESYPDSPYLFYKMIKLDDAQFNEILSDANEEITEGDNFAKPAPRSDFQGQPLKAIADYHARIAEEQCADIETPPFHPDTFFVITTTDLEEKGVLVVSLNCDAKGKVDSFRMPVHECTGSFVMGETGETDWEQIKEEASEAIPPDGTTTSGGDGSGGQGWRHPSGWTRDLGHFCVYKSKYMLKMPLAQKLLNGEDVFRNRDGADWPCRTPPWLLSVQIKDDNSPEENYRIIASGHHQNINDYEGFHPDLVVVIDKADFADEGVLVGRITADGIDSLQRTAVSDAAGRLVSMA